MVRYGFAALVFVVVASGSHLRAQDADEVKRLTEQIELLETKLKLAEKENELLRKEIEQLKREPSRGRETAKSALSDLLPEGKVITGRYRIFGQVEFGTITLTISERDGKKVKASGVTQIADKDPVEHNYEGEVKGNQLMLRTVGAAAKGSMTLTLKGEAVEGTWANSIGGRGTLGFKLTD